jgi:hypothetical protein
MIRAQVETARLDQCAVCSFHVRSVIAQHPACDMRGVLLYAHYHPLAPSSFEDAIMDGRFKSPRQSQSYVMLGCQNTHQMVRDHVDGVTSRANSQSDVFFSSSKPLSSVMTVIKILDCNSDGHSFEFNALFSRVSTYAQHDPASVLYYHVHINI